MAERPAILAARDGAPWQQQRLVERSLAFPLIAGPGALATILLAFAGVPVGSLQFFAQIGVIALVLALAFVSTAAAGSLVYESRAVWNADLDSERSTRSCGRFGPARDGTTVETSSSSRSL